MTTQASMYFCQELPSLLFGDAPLKDSGGALFVQFTLMHFEGFRAPNYAPSFILIVGELLHIKVGQECFGPWSDNSHDLMSRGCYLDIRPPTESALCSAAGGVTRSILYALLSPYHTRDGLKSLSKKVLGGTGSRFVPMRARMLAAWLLSRAT